MVAMLPDQYTINDVEICSGGRRKDCNDQLIKWLVSFEVLDMTGIEGEAIALENPTQSLFIMHGGNSYKPREDNCPHDVIIIWSCNDACLANKIDAKAGGVSHVDQPFPHVQEALWHQPKVFSKLIPRRPNIILIWLWM